MQLVDLTLPTPEENIALDEALLDAAEEGEWPAETLRLWEPPRPIVVLGRSSRIANEVDVAACRELDIPILRRASGGSAIITGPGCLMYAVILSYERHPELRAIDHAHTFVLERLASSLSPFVSGIKLSGTSDLAISGRKFSGNSLRCKRDHLLYHGTLLYEFPLSLIGRLLPAPPRMPAYRALRRHEDFVMNLPAPSAALRQAVIAAFAAHAAAPAWPRERVARLVSERYGREEWNRVL